MMNELGLLDNVEIKTHQSRKELVKLYNLSNYYILPSLFETFGVVAIEALSQGLPVLTTPCVGPLSIVKNYSNGVITDGYESDDILKGIIKIQSLNFDNALISKETLDVYDGKNIIKQYIELLND